jgi:hypothetical protein
MVTEIELFESTDLTPLDFHLWGWMKSEAKKREVDTWGELLARVLDAAARINKREDQLRRKTRDLRTRVAKCTEVDGEIFKTLVWTVTNLSFMCDKFVI